VAVYTLVVTMPDGNQATTVSDFAHDRTTIGDTGVFVSAEHPSVAVARGAGDAVEFLGAWDWNDGQARWTAETGEIVAAMDRPRPLKR
jgi:hypothetical protein